MGANKTMQIMYFVSHIKVLDTLTGAKRAKFKPKLRVKDIKSTTLANNVFEVL